MGCSNTSYQKVTSPATSQAVFLLAFSMEKKKIKPCKLCTSKRYANIALCYAHHKAREKAKKDERDLRRLERKKATKKYQESSKKKLKNACWKLMSEYVRRKTADRNNGFVSCYTCGVRKKWNRGMQAGHFIHNTLDLDERNLRPQCVQCNHHRSGMGAEYAFRLIEEMGLEHVSQLRIEAARHIGYSMEEMEIIKAVLKKVLGDIDTVTNY